MRYFIKLNDNKTAIVQIHQGKQNLIQGDECSFAEWCKMLETLPYSIRTPSPAETETENQITLLKTTLTETDYKIIKCSEYQLAGLEMPYDILELHTERQNLRDEINALENKQ